MAVPTTDRADNHMVKVLAELAVVPSQVFWQTSFDPAVFRSSWC